MNAILIENFISKNWQENFLIEMESWWNYDALFKAQWVVLTNLLSEMRKVANVKQVGFNARFLENMVVCYVFLKTNRKPRKKKCREVYHMRLQVKCNSLTQIRLFCFFEEGIIGRRRIFVFKLLILGSLRKKYLLFSESLKLHFATKSFLQIWLKIISFSRKKRMLKHNLLQCNGQQPDN